MQTTIRRNESEIVKITYIKSTVQKRAKKIKSKRENVYHNNDKLPCKMSKEIVFLHSLLNRYFAKPFD